MAIEGMPPGLTAAALHDKTAAIRTGKGNVFGSAGLAFFCCMLCFTCGRFSAQAEAEVEIQWRVLVGTCGTCTWFDRVPGKFCWNTQSQPLVWYLLVLIVSQWCAVTQHVGIHFLSRGLTLTLTLTLRFLHKKQCRF